MFVVDWVSYYYIHNDVCCIVFLCMWRGVVFDRLLRAGSEEFDILGRENLIIAIQFTVGVVYV